MNLANHSLTTNEAIGNNFIDFDVMNFFFEIRVITNYIPFRVLIVMTNMGFNCNDFAYEKGSIQAKLIDIF